MKRLLWVGVGVGATVVVLRKVQRTRDQLGQVAHAVSPRGIAGSVSSLAESLQTTVATLRESMATQEAALTAALLPSEDEQQRARDRRRAPRDDEGYSRREGAGWDDAEDAFF